MVGACIDVVAAGGVESRVTQILVNTLDVRSSVNLVEMMHVMFC